MERHGAGSTCTSPNSKNVGSRPPGSRSISLAPRSISPPSQTKSLGMEDLRFAVQDCGSSLLGARWALLNLAAGMNASTDSSIAELARSSRKKVVDEKCS